MDTIASGHAAALWVGLHLFLLLVLSGLVSRQRRRHGVQLGDGGVPELIQAIRAFGNATEYAPLGLVAVVSLAVAGAPPFVVHIVGGLLFAGRVLHGFGLSRSPGLTFGRGAGMLLTWLAWAVGGAALLVYAIA
jgi:uncharacterized membrane protein YecN with MAPEG domain